MKYLRKFDSVSDMETAIANTKVEFIGLAYDNGAPKLNVTAPPVTKDTPFYIDVRGAVTLAATSGLQMSTDKTNWTDTTAMTLPTGKTYFRVASDKSSPLKPNWTEDSNSDYDIGGNINSLVKTSFENDTNCYTFFTMTSEGHGFFQSKTKLKSASSLILPATTLVTQCYAGMFNGCTSLTTAPATLPATTMAYECCTNMFRDCTSLTTAPALPATTMAEECYKNMFYNCTSLATAPELPATTLGRNCYFGMFSGCTSLTVAPALPATTLADYCYQAMFTGCTSLTTAPELPVTTLAYGCYRSMFGGCTSLTTAPELPATTLAIQCYAEMFNGCTNLNYIKCLATNISAGSCTQNWVNGVAATGTFVKDPSMEGWTTGNNGIPEGWYIKGITLTQSLNVATIKVGALDSGTGYYTINGGSQVSLTNGTTTIPITQAMNNQTLLAHGEFNGEVEEKTLTLLWTDYTPAVTITETNNYVTISASTADSITYRLGSSGEYSTYTTPVYITENTTIYVIATRTVSGVVYTTNTSQAVTHEVIPPTNLVISCSGNTVTITATNAATIEYNTDGSSTYTTYTEPFSISQTVTVYARATNVDGSITGSQQCTYIDYSIPFYIEDISGSENTVQIKKNNNSAPTLTIEKSTDGETWTSIGSTSLTTKTVTIPANGRVYLRCNTSYWGFDDFGNARCNNINMSGNCNIGGNILSLRYGGSFNGQTEFDSTSSTFYYVFKNNTHIVNTSNLILPGNVKNDCYRGLFYGCTSLTTAPVLPATTLAKECYQEMFYGCTALTTAPELPATTLAQSCYQYMFNGCTALTTAPELPATTLAQNCYQQMFRGCTNLNYIKCLATNISASGCTSYWVYNVAATGTFVKAASMSSWTTGDNGIPSGWTVQDATE